MINITLILKPRGDQSNNSIRDVKGKITIERPKSYDLLINTLKKKFNIDNYEISLTTEEGDPIQNEESYLDNSNTKDFLLIIEEKENEIKQNEDKNIIGQEESNNLNKVFDIKNLEINENELKDDFSKKLDELLLINEEDLKDDNFDQNILNTNLNPENIISKFESSINNDFSEILKQNQSILNSELNEVTSDKNSILKTCNEITQRDENFCLCFNETYNEILEMNKQLSEVVAQCDINLNNNININNNKDNNNINNNIKDSINNDNIKNSNVIVEDEEEDPANNFSLFEEKEDLLFEPSLIELKTRTGIRDVEDINIKNNSNKKLDNLSFYIEKKSNRNVQFMGFKGNNNIKLSLDGYLEPRKVINHPITLCIKEPKINETYKLFLKIKGENMNIHSNELEIRITVIEDTNNNKINEKKEEKEEDKKDKKEEKENKENKEGEKKEKEEEKEKENEEEEKKEEEDKNEEGEKKEKEEEDKEKINEDEEKKEKEEENEKEEKKEEDKKAKSEEEEDEESEEEEEKSGENDKKKLTKDKIRESYEQLNEEYNIESLKGVTKKEVIKKIKELNADPELLEEWVSDLFTKN